MTAAGRSASTRIAAAIMVGMQEVSVVASSLARDSAEMVIRVNLETSCTRSLNLTRLHTTAGAADLPISEEGVHHGFRAHHLRHCKRETQAPCDRPGKSRPPQ